MTSQREQLRESDALGLPIEGSALSAKVRAAILIGKSNYDHAPLSGPEIRTWMWAAHTAVASAGWTDHFHTAWGWHWGLIIEFRVRSQRRKVVLMVNTFARQMGDKQRSFRNQLRKLRRNLPRPLVDSGVDECRIELPPGSDVMYIWFEANAEPDSNAFRARLADRILPALEDEVLYPLITKVHVLTGRPLEQLLPCLNVSRGDPF